LIIIEAVLMGIFATFFMDFLAGILAKRNIIYPFISPEAVGRWFLYIFKGKLIHKDINQTPVLKNEKLWCLISHYLIGITLSGVYLLIGSNFAIVRDHLLMPLLFGIATVFFPWFWLLPSIGIGFMASKSPKRSQIIRTNLINHTNFGFGLLIWIVLLHRFFV
jgi:Protein of unknown function (DUF2938)